MNKLNAGQRNTGSRKGSANKWSALWALVLLSPLSVLAKQVGDIFHTIQSDDGSWPYPSQVPYQPDTYEFNDVSISGNSSTGEMHLVGQTWTGQLLYTFRSRDRWRPIPGQWQPFFDVEDVAGDPGEFSDVSISANSSTGDLHVAGATSDGNLWHTIREAGGSWFGFSDIQSEAGHPASFGGVSISANSSTGEVHLVGQTLDGQLWHTIRSPDGWRFPAHWQPFRNVEAQAGNPGVFTHVSISVNSSTGDLHVVGATSEGNLWHTIRQADGTWLSFSNPPGSGLTFSGASIAVNPDTGELHVMTLPPGTLWHMIRRADGIWLPYEQGPYLPGCAIPVVATALLGPSLHVATIGVGPDEGCP